MTANNASFTKNPHYTELAQWATENIPEVAGFYILHFETAIGNSVGNMGSANHYCGYSENLRKRYLEHLGGASTNGARLTEVANERGTRYFMATAFQTETAQDAYAYEQYFKNSSKNPRRHCTLCGGKSLPCPKKGTLDNMKGKGYNRI